MRLCVHAHPGAPVICHDVDIISQLCALSAGPDLSRLLKHALLPGVFYF